ncbi:MAG: glycoside hydrolase [Bacteroidales bacterium]|nr:glycoside hydrolase [Bacteroidales bacterium]
MKLSSLSMLLVGASLCYAPASLKADDGQLKFTKNAEAIVFSSEATSPQSDGYRIPAIARLSDGSLIAMADLRPGTWRDLGNNNHISVMGRTLPYVDGQYAMIWTPQVAIAEGMDSVSSGLYFAHGDAALMSDGKGNVLLMCASGDINTGPGHPLVARYISHNDGADWEVTDQTLPVESLYNGGEYSHFFTSGRILQSRIIEHNGIPRIYVAVAGSAPHNAILYSDDLGETWQLLGFAGNAQEAIMEELPDGSVLYSARQNRWGLNGRVFMVYTYDDPSFTSGSWSDMKVIESGDGDGLGASHSCNGSMLLLHKPEWGKKHVLLHSASQTPKRQRVTVYYKIIDEDQPELWRNPDFFVTDWTPLSQLTDNNSAYSTMVEDQNGNVAILLEDTNYTTEGEKYPFGESTDGFYDIKYINFSVDFAE